MTSNSTIHSSQLGISFYSSYFDLGTVILRTIPPTQLRFNSVALYEQLHPIRDQLKILVISTLVATFNWGAILIFRLPKVYVEPIGFVFESGTSFRISMLSSMHTYIVARKLQNNAHRIFCPRYCCRSTGPSSASKIQCVRTSPSPR